MFFYYLIFSVFITFFTFLERLSKKFKHGMLISFILIFIFISIRYDFGNDYLMYLNEFKKLNSLENIKGYGGLERLEQGWIYLNKAFNNLGFFFLIFIWSLFYCIIIYKFLRKTLDRKYLYLSLLIFLLNSGIFLVSLSALRQTITILFFIFSIKFIISRKWFWYVFFIYIASLFHSSVLLLLPLYFINYMKVNNKMRFVYFALYIAFYFIGDLFSTYINDLVLLLNPNYSVYLEDKNNIKVEVGSGLGLAFQTINFVILLLVNKKAENSNNYIKIAYKCVIIYFILSPLALMVGMVGRVNFYFSFFQIITIPFVYASIEKRNLKNIYLLLNLFFSVYSLNQFFNSDVYKEKFNDYKTIFNIEAQE